MSAITNIMLRQTSLLTRVYYMNLPRQTLLPFTVHLGPLGKLVMVLGGLYKRTSDVPDSIPNRLYQKTKDRFRARCVIASLFGTGILALIAAMRGKSAKKEGKRYTDNVFNMHRGESRIHDQIESMHRHRSPSERYSPPVDEINK
ncbi:hypothetical protein I4U23_029045 [Adineta vaga]|nr:hypothetical protein I4U23_029045 [Adineta vaga]